MLPCELRILVVLLKNLANNMLDNSQEKSTASTSCLVHSLKGASKAQKFLQNREYCVKQFFFSNVIPSVRFLR